MLEVGASVLLVLWTVRQYWLKSEELIVPPEFLPLSAFALVILAQLVFLLLHRTITRAANFSF